MENETPRKNRLAKGVVLSIVLIGLVLLIAYWVNLWPELSLSSEKGNIELNLETDGEAFLRGKSLGTGTIVLDDAALRSAGVIVPAGTGIEGIADELFAGEQFRGPWKTDTDALPLNAEGTQCFLRGKEPRVVRVWVFALDELSWLAMAVEFRDAQGRVHTKVRSSGIATNTSIMKKYDFHSKSAQVLMTDGDFPE
jgi:hypothetical protein